MEELVGKLPDFADWNRPWKAGEVNEETLARLVYNLKADVESRDEKIVKLSGELDTANASKAGTDAEAQAELKELRKQARELTEAAGKTRPEDQKQIDRLTVALRLGLSESDSKRLVGDTLEEIEADAKVFAEEHGIEIPGSDDGADADGTNGKQPSGPPTQRPTRQPKSDFVLDNTSFAPSNPQGVLDKLPPLTA